MSLSHWLWLCGDTDRTISQSHNETDELKVAVHTEVLKLEHKSLSCYDRIVTFDIESDGTLPVPGYLEKTTGRQSHLADQVG